MYRKAATHNYNDSNEELFLAPENETDKYVGGDVVSADGFIIENCEWIISTSADLFPDVTTKSGDDEDDQDVDEGDRECDEKADCKFTR